MRAPPSTLSPTSPAAQVERLTKVRFTVRDFDQMSQAGIIPERTELVDGEVFETPAVGSAHSVALDDLRDALRAAWPNPRFIRSQATHRFNTHWAPMPDLALLEQRPVAGALIDELPQLVVEVSDDSLSYDLGLKRLQYARAGVPEYWVADLRRRRILIFRRPDVAATEAEHAWAEELVAAADAEATPLAIPSLRLRVADVRPATGATP